MPFLSGVPVHGHATLYLHPLADVWVASSSGGDKAAVNTGAGCRTGARSAFSRQVAGSSAVPLPSLTFNRRLSSLGRGRPEPRVDPGSTEKAGWRLRPRPALGGARRGANRSSILGSGRNQGAFRSRGQETRPPPAQDS